MEETQDVQSAIRSAGSEEKFQLADQTTSQKAKLSAVQSEVMFVLKHFTW